VHSPWIVHRGDVRDVDGTLWRCSCGGAHLSPHQDAQVGAHIFHKCIRGKVLRGKTVVLVTNQLHFLPHADHVYVLRDGTVAEHGSFASLMATGRELKVLMDVHNRLSTLEKDRVRSGCNMSVFCHRAVSRVCS
jgi:hypothetical protein